MKKTSHNQVLGKVLSEYCMEFNIAGISVLPVNSSVMNKLNSTLANLKFSPDYSDYIVKTADARRNFSITFPWAYSIIITAIPFRTLIPALELPAAKSPEYSGLIAGYAMQHDYHHSGRKILEHLVKKLQTMLEFEFRYQICIDTSPLAERTIAAVAGLGSIGINSCLLIPDWGSGCFLAAIVMDAELPEFKLPDLTHQSPCDKCRKCIKSCNNQVITVSPCPFDISRCISFLTMERRGVMTISEMKMLGYNIFGCSNCTRNCPESRLPEDFAVDLEWLLLSPSATIKRAIAGSSIEYAGVTMLRRNAIAVLANRNNINATKLIRLAVKHSNSSILRQTATNALSYVE
jgi:epoxyqueuosine reductase